VVVPELEAFVASQRAVLDALRDPDVAASRLADLWQRCESACGRLERALAGGTVDAALGSELAKSRALAALTAHAVSERLEEVQRDLGRVRAAKKRLLESDRRTRGAGSSCDVSG
jgi:conjugal transfer/entry exclusion protein